ncbi:unnamed protein product [uncultured bacterium]|nr:unnamed protein product [uncultured bacterium]
MTLPNLPLSRRGFLRLAGAGGAAGALAWAGHAQDPAGPPPASDTGAEFITKDTETAIKRGLDYLAAAQFDDGSYTERATGSSVGITALCGLALMSSGSQPGRGPYAKNVSKVLDYMLAAAGGPVPGFLTVADSQNPGRGLVVQQQQAMYSHGFGCLFLSEVCGMLPDRSRQAKVREVLELAAGLSVGAQNREGGWRYDPKPPALADVSVTVAQMMAVRAARNAGVTIRREVFEAGARYILDCQLADGGFSYFRGQGFSVFARSAAAVAGLYSVGSFRGSKDLDELNKQVERATDRGLKYLQQFTPGRQQLNTQQIPPHHYYYGQYYAALAMWMAGGNYWAGWFPAIRDELLGRARGPGVAWTDNAHGAAYATAMSLIVLQLPNNYLPILQK